MERQLTGEDGRGALRDHVIGRALEARSRHGTIDSLEDFLRVLEDRQVVRYPTTVEFHAGPLQAGEFAYACQLGDEPSRGFCIYVHPHFRQRREALPLLIAYHLVRVNYGEIATHEEAELFGATLLGLDVDDYYHAVCDLADEISSTHSCEPRE